MNDERQFEVLHRVWAAYRRALPDPEPSPNFMPELWAKIEAARPVSWTVPLTRLAARLLPLAAAATLAMGIYSWVPRSRFSGSSASGYVDMLAADLVDELEETL
jgi:hypothetical protein